MSELLNNPGFYMSYAVIQAVVVLLLIRLVDLYERQPLSLLALMAGWGATGAAAIALLGNEAVKSMLDPAARIVFGNAIAPPIVEESAKGLALIAAVGPIRLLSRRLGVPVFEGVTAGIVYGAAVGPRLRVHRGRLLLRRPGAGLGARGRPRRLPLPPRLLRPGHAAPPALDGRLRRRARARCLDDAAGC